MPIERGNLGWLVSNSVLVFAGTLTGQSVERDSRNLIITRNIFKIERNITGVYEGKQITLTTLGGTIAGSSMRVAELPSFRKGGRYIIFTDPGRTTYNPITGNQAGVLVVGPDSGIYTYAGVSVVGIENGILQFGTQTLKEYFPQDPSGALQPADPEGTMISAERTRAEDQRPLTVDQFSRLVTEFAARKGGNQ